MAFHINPETKKVGICKGEEVCKFKDQNAQHFETRSEAIITMQENLAKEYSNILKLKREAVETKPSLNVKEKMELDRIMSSNKEKAYEMLKNHNVSKNIINDARIYEHSNEYIRMLVAQHRKLSQDSIIRMASKSDNNSVMITLAERSDLNRDARNTLYLNGSNLVKRKLVRSTTDPRTLHNLARKASSYSICCEVASNPNTSINTLRVLATIDDVPTRVSVASNPNIDSNIASLLLKDSDMNVVRAINNRLRD